MSTERTAPQAPRQPATDEPSPERARALQSLAALNMGDDLGLQGLVCDPGDPDCLVEGNPGAASEVTVPGTGGTTRSE